MTANKKFVMGIDPGTLVSGYAILSVEQQRHLRPHCYGKIQLSAKKELPERYKELFLTVSDVLKSTHIDSLVLETQYVHKNPQSTIKLSMARGVLLLVASLHNIPVFEYEPSVAKKAAVGNGGATKQQVQFMVSKLLNIPDILEKGYEDVADAFALAMCHAQQGFFKNECKAK